MRIARSRLALLLVIMFVASGCATTSPQRVALNSLETTRAAVVATVKVFNDGYQAGTYSEAQRTELGVLYTKYLAADKVAAGLLEATTETNVSAIIADVTVVAGDVISFVQKLKAP